MKSDPDSRRTKRPTERALVSAARIFGLPLALAERRPPRPRRDPLVRGPVSPPRVQADPKPRDLTP